MDNSAFEKKTLTTLQSNILLSLAYFDVFRYPLALPEIIQYSKIATHDVQICEAAIHELIAQELVFKHGMFYSLRHSEHKLDERRNQGAVFANTLMQKAHTYSRIIQSFPFVRCVCISGSLSKGCVDEQGDIDYFIITQPQRLWIARTLLIAYKKIFLLNSHKFFCVNYFVDLEHLDIPDKNIFTATELLTLLPMHGKEYHHQLIAENQWAFSYLPNVTIPQQPSPEHHSSGIKSIMEYLLNGALGNWLDSVFMKLTIRRWKRKFGNFNEEELEQAMRSKKYVSKHHPQQFQQKVLRSLQERIAQLTSRFNIHLHE